VTNRAVTLSRYRYVALLFLEWFRLAITCPIRADPTYGGPEDRLCWRPKRMGCFYVRHHASLLLVCTYDYAYLIGAEGVGDLVQNAFLRAFDGATTFDHAEACEAVVQKRKARKWLARIAENLLRDRYRGQPEVRLLDDDEDLERLGERQMRVQAKFRCRRATA